MHVTIFDPKCKVSVALYFWENRIAVPVILKPGTKVPAQKGWQKLEHWNADLILDTWGSDPHRWNLGLRLLPPYVAIDVDVPPGEIWSDWLAENAPQLCPLLTQTIWQTTPGGGLHLILRCPDLNWKELSARQSFPAGDGKLELFVGGQPHQIVVGPSEISAEHSKTGKAGTYRWRVGGGGILKN